MISDLHCVLIEFLIVAILILAGMYTNESWLLAIAIVPFTLGIANIIVGEL